MSVATLWGYTVTDRDVLPDMLDGQEFDELTANRYAGDERVPANISAACTAIRNYVGWHLYPSAACELKMAMNDRRITFVGRDLLIQLPAKYVSAVESVTVGGKEYATFTFESNGILRVYDVSFEGLKRYSEIVIIYTAGLDEGMMDAIRELVAHRVTHAAASSNGVTTEQVGGVSVTYNASWINNARATALPDDNKEVLAPYRVQGVF